MIYDGAGSMTIQAGDAGNTYTGGTLVKSGTLYLKGNNKGYSTVGTGEVVIESGAKIVGQSSNVFGSRTIADGNVPDVTINGGDLEFNGYLHVNNMTLNGGKITNTNNSPDYAGLDFYDRNATMTVTADTTISSKIINSSKLTIDVAEGKTLSLDSPLRNADGATCEFVKTGKGDISTTNWFGQHEGAVFPCIVRKKNPGSKYSPTSGLSPRGHLERQAEFHASTQDEA